MAKHGTNILVRRQIIALSVPNVLMGKHASLRKHVTFRTSPMNRRSIRLNFQPYRYRKIHPISCSVAKLMRMPLNAVVYIQSVNQMTLVHRENRVSRVFRIGAIHFTCYILNSNQLRNHPISPHYRNRRRAPLSLMFLLFIQRRAQLLATT